jgi:prepilin-type N-terminal cleavage/methylation domain-containing protein
MTAYKKGFTLIELLIVMAILGVLAVVVLVAINPAEQLKRARDTGRISSVTQLGHAAAAYYTGNGYVLSANPAGSTWDVALTDSKEMSTIPSEVTDASTTGPCGTDVVNNSWCYADDGTEYFAVWSHLESDQKKQQCSGSEPYAAYSSIDGRAGVAASEPTAGTSVADWCE